MKELIIYHRTTISNLINRVHAYTDSFRDNELELLGQGLYGTTTEEGQHREPLRGYGDMILKFSIEPTKILCLDFEQFSQMPMATEFPTYDESDFLAKQLQLLGIPFDAAQLAQHKGWALASHLVNAQNDLRAKCTGLLYRDSETDDLWVICFEPKKTSTALSSKNDGGVEEIY